MGKYCILLVDTQLDGRVSSWAVQNSLPDQFLRLLLDGLPCHDNEPYNGTYYMQRELLDVKQ